MPESKTGTDQYYCTNCVAKVNATKTPTLLTAPTIFALGINRFAWNAETYQRDKLYQKVSIPFVIDTVKSQMPMGITFY